MFNKTAPYYDKIYASQNKNYVQEVDYLLRLIDKAGKREPQTLLDIGCGTGEHLKHLKKRHLCEGLDIQPDLLKIAKEKNPELVFHCSDMRSFSLGKQYGIITCLFSSIGYLITLEALHAAFQTMKTHLQPDGLLLIEPWFPPEAWKNGHVSFLVIDEEQFKLVRMSTSWTEGSVSCMDFHYLIGTPERTEHFVEPHRLGLFTQEQMRTAFRQAGLHVDYDEQGPTGRGLYIGTNKE